MFQGEVSDKIECLVCKHQSSSKQPFLMVPLVIQYFGAADKCRSVVESLNMFIKTETLDAENLYQCDHCAKKVEAVKGTKITKLPYILMLSIQRFGYDFETDRRIKINDRFEFTEQLDMKPFLFADDAAAEEFLYELYAVLVHSGNAYGGHYYAYIKSLEDGRWYKFNDSAVTEVAYADVEEAFGGERKSSYGYSYSYYASSASAYLLLYRRIDRRSNTNAVPTSVISAELVEKVRNAKEEAHYSGYDNVSVSVVVECDLLQKKVKLNLTDPVDALYAAAADAFSLQIVPPDEFRLRKYLPYYDVVSNPLPRDAVRTIDAVRIFNNSAFVIEVKSPSKPFPRAVSADSYNLLHIRVYEWTTPPPETATTPHFRLLCQLTLTENSTLDEIRGAVAEQVDIPSEQLHLFRAPPYAGGAPAELSGDAYSRPFGSSGSVWDVKNVFAVGDDAMLADPNAYREGMENVGELVTVFFSALDSKEQEHRLHFDRRRAVSDLKNEISHRLFAGAAAAPEFRLYVDNYYDSTVLQEEKAVSSFLSTYSSNQLKVLVKSKTRLALKFKRLHPQGGDKVFDGADVAAEFDDEPTAAEALRDLRERVGGVRDGQILRLWELDWSGEPSKLVAADAIVRVGGGHGGEREYGFEVRGGVEEKAAPSDLTLCVLHFKRNPPPSPNLDPPPSPDTPSVDV
jgi:hypothetical protein